MANGITPEVKLKLREAARKKRGLLLKDVAPVDLMSFCDRVLEEIPGADGPAAGLSAFEQCYFKLATPAQAEAVACCLPYEFARLAFRAGPERLERDLLLFRARAVRHLLRVLGLKRPEVYYNEAAYDRVGNAFHGGGVSQEVSAVVETPIGKVAAGWPGWSEARAFEVFARRDVHGRPVAWPGVASGLLVVGRPARNWRPDRPFEVRRVAVGLAERLWLDTPALTAAIARRGEPTWAGAIYALSDYLGCEVDSLHGG